MNGEKKKLCIKKKDTTTLQQETSNDKSKKVIKSSKSSKVTKSTLEEPKKIIKKKIKREYSKLGQTKDTPPENDSLRRFYTSLLEQKPESLMAKKWCIEHGLLPDQDQIYTCLEKLTL